MAANSMKALSQHITNHQGYAQPLQSMLEGLAKRLDSPITVIPAQAGT